MNYFMVIGSDITPLEGEPVPSTEVFDLMMEHRCWEFTATAPHLTKMKKGDTLLFYLGGNHGKYFAGEAVVAGDLQSLTGKSSGAFNRKLIPFFKWRLPIEQIRRYPPSQAGLDEMMELSFVSDRVTRPYIGLLLRMGVREITGGDVDTIRRAAGAPV